MKETLNIQEGKDCMNDKMDRKKLGTFRNKQDTDNIIVYKLDRTVIDGEDEIYAEIEYKDKIFNVLLHEKVFPKGECPYNVEEITDVPYFIIENEVYYLNDIFEINFG